MAPKKNVVVNDALLSRRVKFRQGNPKAPGSKSFKRYERYKKASQLADVLKLGGSRADIKNDVEKGFVSFTTENEEERMVTRRRSQKNKREEDEELPSRSGRRRPPNRKYAEDDEDDATDEDDIILLNNREDDDDDDSVSSSSSREGDYVVSDEERRPKKMLAATSTIKKKPGRKKAIDATTAGAHASSLPNHWFVEIVATIRDEEDEEKEFGKSAEIVGPFATRREAVEAAVTARNAEPCFAGWADKYYGGDEKEEDEERRQQNPPFDSGDGPEASCRRRNLTISVISQKEREAARMRAEKSASASLARARARPHVKLPEVTPGSDLGFDDSLEVDDGYDWARFSRSPADPELGGRQHAPNLFRPSFLRSMCRVSNACYAVSAFASNEDLGFRYALGTFETLPERVFVPPPGHYRGGSRAPPTEKLLDTIHTDLFVDPSKCPGPCGLDAARLSRAIERKKNVTQLTHLFVLGIDEDDDGLAQAITKAGSSLQVVCLVECAVSRKVLAALSEHADLRAIHLHKCKSPLDSGGDGDDEAWENLIANAPNLMWCHVSYAHLARGPGFGRRAWTSLSGKESLKVFGYECDSFSSTAFRGRGMQGCLDLLAPTVAEVLPTLANLRYLYAFPDDDAKSRVSLDPLTIRSNNSSDDSTTNDNEFGFY